jgi:hypothetical protein
MPVANVVIAVEVIKITVKAEANNVFARVFIFLSFRVFVGFFVIKTLISSKRFSQFGSFIPSEVNSRPTV